MKATPLTVGQIAPDFSLPDHKGEMVQLSAVNHGRNVLLVFNLGFI